MKVHYKIWIEIERCEVDDDGKESFFECDFPLGIAYRDTFEKAEELQTTISQLFNEL